MEVLFGGSNKTAPDLIWMDPPLTVPCTINPSPSVVVLQQKAVHGGAKIDNFSQKPSKTRINTMTRDPNRDLKRILIHPSIMLTL